MNELAYAVFPRLAASPGNVIFSPATAHAALSMVATGAVGDTRSQLSRALHVDGEHEPELLGDVGATLRSWGDGSHTAHTLRVANRVFGERAATFEPAFLSRMRDAFGAPLEPLDFAEPEPARAAINRWVSERTGEHIPELLGPPDVTRDTRMVLVNAVYFAAPWAVPFAPDMTQPADFHLAGGGTRSVPMMWRLEQLQVAQVGADTLVELPFAGGDLVMRLVLPREGVAPEAVADAAHLGPVEGFAERQTRLALPKFRLESPAMPLTEVLQELGVRAAFDRATADFSGIAAFTSPEDRLFMTNVIQKTFLAVDEQGAEAAAATAAIIGLLGGTAREIRFDRPFLCAVRDVRTGALLFVARISDPAS